jgi:hypothetical protein
MLGTPCQRGRKWAIRLRQVECVTDVTTVCEASYIRLAGVERCLSQLFSTFEHFPF